MKRTNRTPVLAISMDAADPTLVRQLIEQGELPALKSLLEGGTWHCVDSPVHIGSGAVWPTFFTGTDPSEHGVYSHFGWNTDTMSLKLYDGQDLTPFWEPLERNGTTVGVLDAPFAPFVGLSRGFELFEWGPHDVVEGRTRVSPDPLLDLVVKPGRPHPFSSGPYAFSPAQLYVSGPDDYRGLTKLSSDCLAGAQLRGSLATRLIGETRPDLAIIAFHEVHHASHFLWHTVAPQHRLFDGEEYRRARIVKPTLLDIYREVDRQIAQLVEVGGPEATVLVFSLRGFQPARGIPTILDAVLHDLGLAHYTDWGTRSWPEYARSVLKEAKRRTPSSLKKLYHNVVPNSVRYRLWQPTIPAYDWSRTRAFSLPTDQHGWIRLNMLGREAKGVLPPEQYDETCDLLEGALRALTTEDGRPLVQDVLRLSRKAEEALSQQLPDLIVHWHTAAFESPVRIKNSSLIAYPELTQFTGLHAPDSFCIIKQRSSVGGDGRIGRSIAAKDLHRHITAALTGAYSDDEQ